MDPLKIYDYLTLTRQRYIDAARSLTPQQYQQSFPFGLHTLGSTLTHLMVSEWYYIERLEGRAVPHYEHWPIKYEHPPALDVIERTWQAQATNVRASIAANQRDWSRPITWLSFPDDTRGNKQYHITCTAGDLVTQLALHEVHHRAQILVMLRLAGAPIVQDIDYNALMFQRVEAK